MSSPACSVLSKSIVVRGTSLNLLGSAWNIWQQAIALLWEQTQEQIGIYSANSPPLCPYFLLMIEARKNWRD